MAKTEKWEPSNLLALAIGKLEEQQSGNCLAKYGQSEHLAVVRYLITEICLAAKVPLSDEQKSAIKKEFAENSEFLAYASNAKKKLEAVGLLQESKKVDAYN